MARTLENSVFHEMRQSVQGCSLVAAARADHDAYVADRTHAAAVHTSQPARKTEYVILLCFRIVYCLHTAYIWNCKITIFQRRLQYARAQPRK